MTLSQIKQLLGWTSANFPGMQEKNLKATAELWSKMLADIPYEVAEKAVLKVLSTAKFFPTVAEIREAAAWLTTPKALAYDDAWGMVIAAIGKYGYYREEEGLASLPVIVRQIVKNIGWRELCICEESNVIRGQFRLAYEQHKADLQEENVLPAEIRLLKASQYLPELPPAGR